MQKYIFASHFVTQNVTNAFDALQKNIFFASHFVTQNVTNAFDATRESGKMHFGCAKMHFCITFSKGKCSAVQKCCVFCFAKNKDAVQKCIFASTHHILFCKNAFLHQQNVTNAFDALPKCILASNAFDAKMHFGVHFPKENVQQRCAKMHLMQKCIFATHHILRSKMFSITFSKGFLTFCKQNVMKTLENVMRTFCWCKNAFDAKMHFGCAKMHLMHCKNAFLCTFSFGKCTLCKNLFLHHILLVRCVAEHFPLENVR